MGLVIELKKDQRVQIGDVLVAIIDNRGRNRFSVHIEAPKEVLIKRVTNGSNDPTTKEK